MKPKRSFAIGQKYHHLTLTRFIERIGDLYYWEAQCELCGNLHRIRTSQIGRTKSCGCLLNRFQPNINNLTGKRFGRLLVIERDLTVKKNPVWFCKCDCGNIKRANRRDLTSGKISSCGCLFFEVWKKKIQKIHTEKLYYKLTDEERATRIDRNVKYIDYHTWVKKVKKNCNYKCAKCNNTKKLHAHHIFNYQDYPDLRVDPNNGVCLCKDCHKEFHSIYGLKNNNQQQLDEFLSLDSSKI